VDVYREAILEALPPEPEVPLAAPPVVSYDNLLVCPGCGGTEVITEEVEDASLARCTGCGCEFTPRLEPVSRQVIRGVREHRERQIKRFLASTPD
jgi:hypothetical protein